ncbi:MAG: selenocysteine-specific translation elongation factor [Actinomycetota bacterium]
MSRSVAEASASNEGTATLHVVATAGHVDHGKSSLIRALTGIEPDRWAEEKRRGLTIDLGFAWATLPSGREVGFVDVPGHERFVRNMLAGVGPVRDVLFVVAADEGWKPQSEEHLAILDLLGAHGVIALTKTDLVDAQTRQIALDEVREHVAGTVLEDAPMVACSITSGEGIDELVSALDDLTARAAPHQVVERPRLHVDRVFSVAGAGTVVTGTLSGGPLQTGEEVELFPTGIRARIRGLQSHERPIERATPVARVAVNLVGIDRSDVRRGVVVGQPDRWAVTDVVDVQLTPVRDLAHPISGRGAFKVYAGAAELDARVRILGGTRVDPGETTFARLQLAEPFVFDVSDPIVLRDAGRRETVAGGRVLDVRPERAKVAATIDRLSHRAAAPRSSLPELLAHERGAIRVEEAEVLTGVPDLEGTWIVDPAVRDRVRARVVGELTRLHREHPLRAGEELATIRTLIAKTEGVKSDQELAGFLLDELVAAGDLSRTATTVALATHAVALSDHDPRLSSLTEAVGHHPERPPTVQELVSAGHPADLIDASVASGRLVRVSNELVFDPSFIAEAERVLRSSSGGISVSAFRASLGTSRKYAVPLLEHLDRIGISRREGDLRYPREPL